MEPELKIDSDGTQHWYLNGKLHRKDGPACVWLDGIKCWCLGGKFHRTDGPAIIEPDNHQAWYLNDKRHRTNGPAIVWSSGLVEYHAFVIRYDSLEELQVRIVMDP